MVVDLCNRQFEAEALARHQTVGEVATRIWIWMATDLMDTDISQMG